MVTEAVILTSDCRLWTGRSLITRSTAGMLVDVDFRRSKIGSLLRSYSAKVVVMVLLEIRDQQRRNLDAKAERSD